MGFVEIMFPDKSSVLVYGALKQNGYIFYVHFIPGERKAVLELTTIRVLEFSCQLYNLNFCRLFIASNRRDIQNKVVEFRANLLSAASYFVYCQIHMSYIFKCLQVSFFVRINKRGSSISPPTTCVIKSNQCIILQYGYGTVHFDKTAVSLLYGPPNRSIG